MSTYTEVPMHQRLLRHPTLPVQEEWPLQHTVPLPLAYSRNVSYDYSRSPSFSQSLYADKNSVRTPSSDVDSFTGEHNGAGHKNQESGLPLGKRQLSLLIILRGSRIYTRVATVVVMLGSLSLILAAIISFSKAKNNPTTPLRSNVPVTDQPCIVFSGIAAMNLVLSISLLVLSCASSKFRKSNDAINAVFCIISAVGFASSMGACFYLNKQSSLQADLWHWACDNHKNGIISDVLDFGMVCQVVSYSWKLGLVQASLELLTFIVGVTAFVLLKFSNFARFGSFSRLF